MSFKLTRRDLLPLAGAGLMAGFAGFGIQSRRRRLEVPASKPRVTIYKADSYSEDLTKHILSGVQASGLDVRDKKVLIQAHLEGLSANRSVNADPSVVAAVVGALQSMGAAQVHVGAGPSWERDTIALAEAAGYRAAVRDFEKIFVDLNRDDLSPVEGFPDGILYLPIAALRADLIVSIAKMKTDSQAGAALSLENLTGLVPGSVYGWPKDAAFGTSNSQQGTLLAALSRVFRRSFAIVDGIVGMEGNGPLEGTPKNSGVLVMGDNLTATDATCCRIMGIDPARIGYLTQAASSLNHIDPQHIDYLGESPESVRTDFELVEQQRSLRLT